jgi:predicted nucleic-acid-binding protein
MIGLDTNVLLRIVLADDPQQHRVAVERLKICENSDDAFFINDIVLSEFAWTLKAGYGYPREDIALVIQSLIDVEAYRFEHRATVVEALRLYRESSADFPDCLILAKNLGNGCRETLSFDKAMRGLPQVTLLS